MTTDLPTALLDYAAAFAQYEIEADEFAHRPEGAVCGVEYAIEALPPKPYMDRLYRETPVRYWSRGI